MVEGLTPKKVHYLHYNICRHCKIKQTSKTRYFKTEDN